MATSGLAVTDEQGYADHYGDVRMPNNVPATAAFYTATDVSCDLVALGWPSTTGLHQIGEDMGL